MRSPTAAVAGMLLLLGCRSPTQAEDPLPGPTQDAAVVAVDDEGVRSAFAAAYLAAPPEAIYPWFSDPARMRRWLADEVELGRAPGEPFRLTWHAPELTITGEVVAVEPPVGVEVALDPYGPFGPSILRFVARPEADGTRLWMEQGPFAPTMEGEAHADAHREAWSRALRVLRFAFERELPTTPSGPPEPPTAAEFRTAPEIPAELPD